MSFTIYKGTQKVHNKNVVQIINSMIDDRLMMDNIIDNAYKYRHMSCFIFQ
jgi:hypothetical protein